MAGPTSKPFLRSSIFALIAFALIAALGLWAFGVPSDQALASELAGRLFGALAVAALMVGFFARRSRKAWSNWRFAGIFFLALMLTAALEIASLIQR